MAEGLLAQLEARGAAESDEGAELLDLLVMAARHRNDSSDDARRLAERAIALKERLHGPDHPAVADSVYSAGYLRKQAGDYDAADSLYARCLSIREKALSPDDLAIANVMLEIANLRQRQGRFAEAVPAYERALAIREKQLGADHADVASVLHNMGNLRLRMGDYVQSRRHYQRALEIRRKVLGPRHIDVALTLITMGVLFQNMGDYVQAQEVLEEAAPICREAKNLMLLSTALNNLGNVHWSVGEPAKARDAYRQALDIKMGLLGPDHFDLSQELNNLAVAHKALGEYDVAIPLYEQAIRLVERQLGPDHFFLGEHLNNLANVLVLKGRLAEARPLYERSMSIRVARLGKRHPEVSETIMNMAGLELTEGKRAQALALAIEARDLRLEQIRDTLAYLPETAAIALASSKDQPHTVLFEGLRTAGSDTAAWLEACWSWTLQRRGIVLEEMAARHRTILGDSSPEARSAWESLAAARTDLGALWEEGPGNGTPAAYQEKLRSAIDRKESAEERLADRSARFRSDRLRRRADLAGLRRSLRPGEAVVEFARVEIGLSQVDRRPVHDVALIVGPDGVAAWEDLGPAESIDRLVSAWRADLASSFDAAGDTQPPGLLRLASSGQALRHAVWDPVAGHLRSARLIYVVPDGSLHQVDFGALPVEGDRYLIETAPPMQTLSASRDLLARGTGGGAADPAGSRGLLAVGSPDFTARPENVPVRSDGTPSAAGKAKPCIPLRETVWAPLPESAREVETIAGLLKSRGPVTTLTGARATADALLREAPGRRILHVATHGFFLGACGEDTGNPLLLSGLVLAGAGAAKHDPGLEASGILTAEEIVAADLRGVELAVLSACDTGRGEVEVGEGVFGLRRALEIAGVKTVVMSLWPVADRQARRWMGDFYRGHVIEGAAPRDAARHASLELLSALRDRGGSTHPYLWTGFVVAGASD